MFSRRYVVKFSAAAPVAAALGTLLMQRCELIQANSPEVAHFHVPLPIPPVLRPVRSDDEADYYEITQREAQVEILPGLHTTVWGYEGIFPGPTIKARHGRTTVIRHLNRLAIPTVVHLHGGATPSESDGFPTELQIPDGHPSYVLQSAMCDVTPSSSDPGHGDRSRSSNSTRTYVYPNKQRAATLWYHDHAMGFNGRNIYMGLAGLYLIEDEEEAALPLPRGICDIPLMLFMRTFGADGALVYNSVGHTGAQGDVMLVNGAPWPRWRLRDANTASAFLMLRMRQPFALH